MKAATASSVERKGHGKALQTSWPSTAAKEVPSRDGFSIPLDPGALLTSIWEEEDVPKQFRNATFVSLFKNKGSTTDCGSYRGISVLSVAGKILARVILSCFITNISEENLLETQCGFRSNRSTIDMISERQVQEKYIKQNMDLVVVFIGLTKAFDTVNREALWVILPKLRCPTKLVNLIRQFHDNMTGQILSDGDASEPFSNAIGVKQGCVTGSRPLQPVFHLRAKPCHQGP